MRALDSWSSDRVPLEVTLFAANIDNIGNQQIGCEYYSFSGTLET